MNQINYKSLTQPLTPEQQKVAYDAFGPKNNFPPKMSPWFQAALFGGILLPFIIALTNLDFGTVLFIFPSIAAVILLGVLANNRMKKDIERKARLYSFAKDNKFQISFSAVHHNKPGLIFSVGRNQSIREQLMIDGKILIGNYTFTIGSGKNKRIYKYGYVEITLPRKLPHMLLDAKANNMFGISNLPTTFSADQKMQLEGDFSDYFDLYVPAEYGRDALYVFTPDVMELAIEHGNMYDVEIVDDKMYLYRSDAFKLDSQTELEEVFRKITALRTKFDRQVDYYADERVASRQLNQVAEQGSRLQKGIPWKIVIIVGGFIFFYLVSMIAPYLITIFSS